MNLFRWLNLLFRGQAKRRPFRRSKLHLVLEHLEDRLQPAVTGFSPISEVGNNIAKPTLGTAGTDLLRVSPAAYSDGISSPSLANNPSARVLSDLLNNQADPKNPSEDINTVDGNSLTDFGYTWGQFIDHDMDLTTTNTEKLTIPADPNDPNQMGDQTFSRSTFDPATGTSTSNPRQQTNSVTSFLDLSQVYGSTTAIADALRTHSGGQLKTSPGNMLPYDNSTYFTPAQLALFNMANDSGMVATQNLFVTGDVRGNENVELTALQTLFVRNHNRIASQLQKSHPTWSDEQLFQEARKLNIAEYQSITYNYYLPDLLGRNAIRPYSGYHSNVNPAIATEFSTVAFRFGHSMLDNEIERHTNNGTDITTDPTGASISLAQDFFDANLLNPAGVTDPFTGHTSTDIGPILKANADGIAQATDLMAVNDVRNLLFGNGGQTDNGLDLMARDVERARDDGIGSYNQLRQAYGLTPVTSFAQITRNVTVQNELKAAYGTVANIDAFEGGLAEDHVPGSDMGPLFTRILVDQFTRLRDGDRYFYLNETFNSEEMSILRQGSTLAQVIQANTNVTNLQSDVFVYRASISGTVSGPSTTRTQTNATPTTARGTTVNSSSPTNTRGTPINTGGQTNPHGTGGQTPAPGTSVNVSGLTVQLLDADGNVVATTVTDAQGRYTFTQQSGLTSTGTYSVVLVLPGNLRLTTKAPASITVSHGDTNVTGVNFGVDVTVPVTVAV